MVRQHSQMSEKTVEWRNALTTLCRNDSVQEVCALEAAVHGLSFSDICEAMLCQNIAQEELAAVVIGWLQNWLAEGLIYDIECEH